MIHTKRVMEMARKWHKSVARRRRTISLGLNSRKVVLSSVPIKGQFAASPADDDAGRNAGGSLGLSMSLPSLQMLLKLEEEDFDLDIDGALTFASFLLEFLHRKTASKFGNLAVCLTAWSPNQDPKEPSVWAGL